MSKQTQNQMLIKYLKSGKKITSAGAMDTFGISRLASRIYDIRSMGIDVQSRTISVHNRWGDNVRVKQYFL